MSSSGGLWYVKLPDGEVHRVTLDQLDEAFQGGHVDVRTQVLAETASRWMTLGEILGDDEPESPAAPYAAAPARGYVPQVPYSLRPMSVDFEVDPGDSDVEVGPARRRSGAKLVFAAFALAAAIGGVAVARPDLRASVLSRAGSRMRSLSDRAWQTVAAASPGPVAVAPPPEAAESAPPPTPPIAPGLPAAAAPPVQQPAVPAAPAAAATPPASTAAVAGDSPLAPRFGSPQKQHPLPVTRQRRQGAPSRVKSAGGHSGPVGSKPPSQPFTTGGNRFDPLNSSI